MRSKRRMSLVVLLLAFIALIIFFLLPPDPGRLIPGSRSKQTSRDATSVTSPPQRPERPSSPSYLPIAEIPIEVKKEAFAADLAVKGRVMNTRGEGIPSARVELALAEQLTLDPPVVATAVTDSEGYYHLGIQPVSALASLVAEKEGYARGRVSFDLQGDTGSVQQNLILSEATATLSGRIVNTRQGALANAKVAFGTSRNEAAKQYTTSFAITSSDENGRYLLTDLPAGAGMLSVRLPGYSVKYNRLELEAGENQSDIELEGRPTFYIQAKNRLGEPVKYPTVMTTIGRRRQPVGFGDESGSIDVLLTPEVKSFDWEVRAVGYRPGRLTGNPKGGRAEVILEDGPLVSGVVLSTSGHPIARALVLGGCRGGPGGQTRTDEAGRFSMNTACTADLFVEISHPGYITSGIRLSADAARQDLMIKLREPEGGITGWVLHSDSRPVTRFIIQIDKDSGDEFFSINRVISNPEGRFSILDLPSGQLEMQITAVDGFNDESPMPELETVPLNIRNGMVYSDLIIRLKEQPAAQE